MLTQFTARFAGGDPFPLRSWVVARAGLSITTVGLLFFLSPTGYAQSGETPRRPQKLRIANMQAMLFFENTGKFSPDVFTNQVNLWNTTIEGASREGASESMLVVVELRAEGDGFVPTNRKVQLDARYRIEDGSRRGRPAVFSKVLTINIGTENKFFAAFWLYDTGCYPVELTARIVGQKGSLRKRINFGCGE